MRSAVFAQQRARNRLADAWDALDKTMEPCFIVSLSRTSVCQNFDFVSFPLLIWHTFDTCYNVDAMYTWFLLKKCVATRQQKGSNQAHDVCGASCTWRWVRRVMKKKTSDAFGRRFKCLPVCLIVTSQSPSGEEACALCAKAAQKMEEARLHEAIEAGTHKRSNWTWHESHKSHESHWRTLIF